MSTTATTTDTAPPASITSSTTAATIILHFFLWDSSSNTAKNAFYLKAMSSVVDYGSLTDVRKIMAGSAAQKQYATCVFVSAAGSKVPDDWSVKEYYGINEKKQQSSGSEEQGNQKDQNETTASTAASEAKFYLQKPAPRGSPSQDAVPLPSLSDINIALPSAAELPVAEKLEAIRASYAADKFQASADALSHASDLTAPDWSTVSENNALLYGFGVLRQRGSDGVVVAAGIGNARRAAFQFKPREIPLNALTNDVVGTAMVTLRMPSFVVDDQSYISVYETTNTFQSSLAQSGFSEADVKIAAAGGAFGVTIGASAGYAQSSSSASTSTSMQTSNRMNISYNFPRVTLFLDDESLELTERCKNDLSLVKDVASLTTFLNMYGQFFATRVQLGGRLFASDESSTIAGSSTADKAKSMKVSASVSVASSFASVSASASYGTASRDSSAASSSSFQSSLTWQANGGNTLLANNPAAWCSTVGLFHNWRIIKQDGVLHILDVIGKMQGYNQIPTLLTSLIAANPSASMAQAPVSRADEIYLSVNAPNGTKQYLGFYTSGIFSIGLLMLTLCTSKVLPLSALGQAPPLVGIGAVACDPATADTTEISQNFQVQNLDRSPVGKANYETKYYLRGTTSGLYMGYHMENGRTWPRTGTQPCAIIFRNPSGSKTVAPITNSSAVNMVVCDYPAYSTTGNPDEIGIVYNTPTTNHAVPVIGLASQHQPLTFTLDRHVAG